MDLVAGCFQAAGRAVRILSVYFTGGLTERFEHGPGRYGWAHSASIQVLENGIYAELRAEDLYVPDHVQFRTVRAGYLLHPKPTVAWGVTFGLRSARGYRVQDAVEIGLPLAGGLGWPDGTLQSFWRLEPTYLISSARVSWNYRFQIDLRILRTPLITGLAVEAKTVRQGDPYFATMTLLVGARR